MSDPGQKGNGRKVEQETVRTTIVGGRPPGAGKPLGSVPRGIEVLIKKAAVDPQFRALLLDQRAEAAKTIGLELRPSEVAMLAGIPQAQLDAIISQTRVDARLRPVLMGAAAAVMLVALGAEVVAGEGCAGIRPLNPPDQSPSAAQSAAASAPASTNPRPAAPKPAPEENFVPIPPPPPPRVPQVMVVAGVRAMSPVDEPPVLTAEYMLADARKAMDDQQWADAVAKFKGMAAAFPAHAQAPEALEMAAAICENRLNDAKSADELRKRAAALKEKMPAAPKPAPDGNAAPIPPPPRGVQFRMVAGLMAISPVDEPPVVTAEDMLSDAKKAMNDQRWADAVAKFKEMAAAFPAHARAPEALETAAAICENRLNDAKSAAELRQRAAALKEKRAATPN